MTVTQEWLSAWAEKEASHDPQPSRKDNVGAIKQRARLVEAARMVLAETPGDIIEIGCFRGATSKRLAEVAQEFKRRLVCIDSWSFKFAGASEKAIFNKNVAPFVDVIDTHVLDAHSPRAKQVIASRRYAFAFLDDGHGSDDVRVEMETVTPVCDGVIAVDDYHNLKTVQIGLNAAMEELDGWVMMHAGRLREAWVVRE